jgi:hypothetical protein
MALLFNEFKDDIFTIKLPDNDLIFTRYLYIKDEVKVALLISLLDKKEDAIFWVYELFMSGFKQETFKYIWQIYYDFYATLNPTFEEYFIKKHIEWVAGNCKNDLLIGIIVKNLLVRPSNTDVFMLRNICEQFEIEVENINTYETLLRYISICIEEEDYRSLTQIILFTNYKYNYTLLYSDCLTNLFPELTLKKNSLIRSFVSSLQVPINPKLVLLAKLIELCTRKKGIQQSKSVYRTIDESTITLFYTDIHTTLIKPYNVLKYIYTSYNIQEVSKLGLFKLVRNKYNENNLKNFWRRNWEYHASFSPLWFERIKRGGGYVDYNNKRVEFINDECMEAFYNQYGYEADEQSIITQNKAIGHIKVITDKKIWLTINNGNNIFIPFDEELEQFDFVIF